MPHKPNKTSPVRGFSRTLLIGLAGALLGLWGCGGGKAAVSPDPWPEISANSDLTWDEQILGAKNMILTSPGDPQWPHTLGALYASVDSLEHAEGYWLKSLSVDPGYAPSLSRLTQMYYTTGRHDDAISYLETARTVYAERQLQLPGELLGALALHYDARGDMEQLPQLHSEMDSNTPSIATTVGPYLLLRGSDFLSAREPAERAMLEYPGNAIHFNNFGITRLQAGDPHQARDAFLNAHKLDGALPGPLYNLALVERFYFMDDAAAKEWFDRYWVLSQEDPDDLYSEFYGNDETTETAATSQ